MGPRSEIKTILYESTYAKAYDTVMLAVGVIARPLRLFE